MSVQNKSNVRKYKKPLNINIGMLFFAVILIYIVICVFLYFFSSKHIYSYQVKSGSLSEANVYEGIAFRDETIVKSPYSGYINYFAREGERTGSNNLVCTVDETGQFQELVNGKDTSANLLSEKDLLEIKNEVVNFAGSFDEKKFRSSYDFKFLIEGNVMKFSNRNLLENLSQINSQQANGLVNVCNAPTSGIVVYSVDGFEDRNMADVCEEWFSKDEYEKTQLINKELVEKGDPIYKLSTQENWHILIPVTEERAKELEEEEYVKVKFLKNQYESWGKVESFIGTDQKTYVKLSFTNSMITFAMDRFIDIELITNVDRGLKVPNSSIVEKEFFLIPTAYITKGGNKGEYGVLKETYDEEGNATAEFTPVTIYNEENGEYYIGDESLRIGLQLFMPDSSEKYTISKSGKLIGVYNINKGYADFKQIQIIQQNEEYAIIQSNTKYGLVAFDYIALDASSVEDNDFIND